MVDKVVVGRPMEILLVEDSRVDARLTIEALQEGQLKHRLTIVRDGEEAMLFLHQEKWFAQAPRPDLVLLDLNLPRKDGREVLKEIKADYRLNEIPVIILTASQNHKDELRSQMLNVDGYMQKPVDLKQFIALVRQLKAFWHADVILPTDI
ncbi:MAG: response regulator [Planctomycetota bacterium]|nr:response regulator [Planctomycetota bacterium]